MGTAGLFGAVSASTMVAGMAALEHEGIAFEAWVPALYPFMDIPALVLAIVLGNLLISKTNGSTAKFSIRLITKNSLIGVSVLTLIGGVLLGIFSQAEGIFYEFYNPLFKGFLSILMLTLGIEAYKHMKELKDVAHWYIIYAVLAPIVHGFIGFGLAYIAYLLVGLSPGGVIMIAIIAASNSDISGPPTIRSGLPTANPSAYLGASTGIGTPVAILICIPLFIALGHVVFGF